jgi:Putative Actinobacterial Holin-X, holin superfamily III
LGIDEESHGLRGAMGSNPGERYSGESDCPTGELVKQLSEQTSRLIRQELALARAEMTQKGKAVGIAGGMFGAAGVLVLLALGSLTACLILALALVLDAWLAALIVAAAYAAIAGVLALVGKRKVQEASPPLPEQTKESVQEDVKWTKERARAARQ